MIIKKVFKKEQFGWYEELKNLKFNSWKEVFCFIQELTDYVDIQFTERLNKE